MLDSAELRLYADSVKSGRTIQVQRAASAWSEMSVTWSGQPAGTGPAATTSSGSTKGSRSWTVTAQVADMYAGGQAHGFVVRDSIENQDGEQTFNSREKGQNVPTLILRFRPGTAPPTTTTTTTTPARRAPPPR